ncbi:MAG: tetratricopeptide repeat protein, partial [Acidobacteriota bacterium]
DRRRLYGETLSPRLTRQWGELRAVIYGDYKYIHGPRPELYDIGADPDELNDLIAAAPDVAADLERRLADYLATHAVPDLDASSALDEESLRKLQALGYLQASGEKVGPIEERLRSDGDPPQDHAHTTAAYSQAKAFLFQNKPVEAREFLIDLLRDAPSNVHYLELMVSVDVQLGQLDAALGRIEQLLEASAATGYPPREKLQMQMAGIHLQRGQLDAAYDAYREALAIAPDAAGFYRLAQMHQARGEVHEQKRFLTRALDEDPAFAPARIDLAVWHAVAGEMEQAEGLFAEALRTQPYFARAHYNFGAFLAQTSRLEMAAARFARAVTLQPDYHQAHQALVEVHLMMDRVDDARRHIRGLAQQAPDAPETQRARAALEAFDG